MKSFHPYKIEREMFMKKVISLFVVLLLSLSSLTACSQDSKTVDAHQNKNNVSNVFQNKNNVSNVFQVGDMILKENNHEYYYGGIVNNTIVIQVILYEGVAYSTSMSLYFPAYKYTVITLPKTSHQFVVENVDGSKGTITLKQIK
jgi:hypothetical protein